MTKDKTRREAKTISAKLESFELEVMYAVSADMISDADLAFIASLDPQIESVQVRDAVQLEVMIRPKDGTSPDAVKRLCASIRSSVSVRLYAIRHREDVRVEEAVSHFMATHPAV